MIKKLFILIGVMAIISSLFVVNVGAASACELGGLTPGFWKNHTEAWDGYWDPDTVLESSGFDIPDELGLDNYTLLEGLKFGGGKGEIGAAKILLRSAIAAYLNASVLNNDGDPDIGYYIGAGTVREMTNSALASMDRATMLSLASEFDYNNNLGID